MEKFFIENEEEEEETEPLICYMKYLLSDNPTNQDEFRNILSDAIDSRIWEVVKRWKDFNLPFSPERDLGVVDFDSESPLTYDEILKIRELFGDFVQNTFYYKVLDQALCELNFDHWELDAIVSLAGDNFCECFSVWRFNNSKELNIYSVIVKYGFDCLLKFVSDEYEIISYIVVVGFYKNSSFMEYVLNKLKKRFGAEFLDDLIRSFIEEKQTDEKLFDLLIAMGARQTIIPNFKRNME